MKKKLIMLASAAAIVITCGVANAADISGTYAVVGIDHCVSGAVGSFNNLQQILSGTSAVGTTVHSGFATFKDGMGSATIASTSTLTNFYSGYQTGAWLDTSTGTSSFTYTVTGDEYTRTFTSNIGTYTTGARTGQTITITGGEPSNGVISKNTPPVLLETNSQPTMELWTFSNGDTVNAFCSNSRTLTKVAD
jgi:hypothetical protein